MSALTLEEQRRRDIDLAQGLKDARATVRRSITTMERLQARGCPQAKPMLAALRKAEVRCTDELNIVTARLRGALT